MMWARPKVTRRSSSAPGGLTSAVTVPAANDAAAWWFGNRQTGQDTLHITLTVLAVLPSLEEDLPLAA